MIVTNKELGDQIKCNCPSCNGTGIYKGFTTRGDLAVVCSTCNGSGYYILKNDKNARFEYDENTNTIYGINNNEPFEATIFKELHVIDNINYVIYDTQYRLTSNYLFEHGIDKVYIIKYSDFLNGKLPLPLMEYTCPAFILQNYGDEQFDNDCPLGSFIDCTKFGKEECWNKFYGKAKTLEEKQKLLTKLRK